MTPSPLPLLSSGKVRELYDAGDGRLLMVASDRISAFDVIMEEPIPQKGRVLTAMTAAGRFWLIWQIAASADPPMTQAGRIHHHSSRIRRGLSRTSRR